MKDRIGLDWGVVIAAFAVAIATSQAWISYQALKDNRNAVMADRRVELCVAMIGAARQRLQVSQTFHGLLEASRRDEAAWDSARLASLDASRAYTEGAETLHLLGPDGLRSKSAALSASLTELEIAPLAADASADNVMATATSAREALLGFERACRETIGVGMDAR